MGRLNSVKLTKGQRQGRLASIQDGELYCRFSHDGRTCGVERSQDLGPASEEVSRRACPTPRQAKARQYEYHQGVEHRATC